MARLALLVALAAVMVWSAAAQYPQYFDRRANTLFNEGNGDGGFFLTENDLTVLGDQNVEHNQLSGDAAQLIRDRFLAIWTLISTNYGGSDPINSTIFTNIIKSIGEDDLDKTIAGFYTPVYGLFDVDGEPEVSEEEFVRFFAPFGLPDNLGELAFGKVDSDGNGKMSEAELFGGLKVWYNSPNVDYADQSFVLSVINGVLD